MENIIRETLGTGPAHQGRGPSRFRSLQRRGTMQPGCSSSGRHEPSARERTSTPPPPPVFEISTRNRFAPLHETECDAVIIGDSIVLHVRATAAKGKVHTHCLPDARSMNNIRLRQTEILKKDFRSLVEKVRTTSPMTRIIVSGPLPTFQRGIERFSRLFALNEWLESWCKDQ
ncbi:hypothetical protein QTP86_007354 [Hemibagrus guttatus]|nr:hypothetical protein QTP86_007354 [Hemibagrus guttatus]